MMTRAARAANFRRSDRTHFSSLRIEYFPEPSNGGEFQWTGRSRTRPATAAAMKEVASNVRFPSIRYQSGNGITHSPLGLFSWRKNSPATQSPRTKSGFRSARRRPRERTRARKRRDTTAGPETFIMRERMFPAIVAGLLDQAATAVQAMLNTQQSAEVPDSGPS